MKTTKVLAISILLFGLSQAVWSQEPSAKQTQSPAILGYLDPQTGSFKPLARPSVDSEEAAATATPHTGKFVFSFTINVASAIPSSETIQCQAQTSTSEISGTNISEFVESATVNASRSGSTATCTVTIPYSWNLSNANGDSVQLGFLINTAGSTISAPNRVSDHIFAHIAVPVNGATTTETLRPTI